MPPEPLILAFDTSAAHCAAAVLSGGTLLAARQDEMARGQAEALFPLLDSLLKEAGAGWRDLTALGVGIGPGNFTGVRIAVAAARGLALSLAIPAHGVSTFEALARHQPRPLLTSVDARQGRLYLHRFGGPETVPGLADLSDLSPDLLPGLALPGLALPGLCVTGHAAGEIAARLGAVALPAALPLAVAIAEHAAEAPPTGRRPAPLYLRPADAAPARDLPPVILP